MKSIFPVEARGQEDISSLAALATAFVATVGTGSIIGVAAAIKSGEPGALFWMRMAVFFGMAIEYAEGILTTRYRTRDANGDTVDGPIHYTVNGMDRHQRPLAITLSIFGVMMALLGSRTFTQVNSIINSLNSTVGWPSKVISLVLVVLISIIIFGGIQSISKAAEKVVPFMVIVYIVITFTIPALHLDHIIPGSGLVLHPVFTGRAAMGGFAGATVVAAIQAGIVRGIFFNESGFSSTSIAAAVAETEGPVEQGLVSTARVFIDTIIICTLAGLPITATDG